MLRFLRSQILNDDKIPHCERMEFLVKYLQYGVRGPVPDVVVDGQGDALEGVLQVGLGHRGVVEEDGGARAGLFELAHRPRVGEVHLALLADHAVWGGEKEGNFI